MCLKKHGHMKLLKLSMSCREAWIGVTVGTTVASPVLMDKVVAMNGGYRRFLCSYPPENQTWQAGTSP